MNLINNEGKKQEGNVSLDMLRVVVMFLIVLSHVMLHGKVLEQTEVFTTNYYVNYIIYAFISVHVNCFVLISGYFLSTKALKYKQIFSLWGKMLFWSFFILLFLFAIGVVPFSFKTIIKALLPFTQQRYWFMTTYLLMYCLIPFLNAAISTLSKKQYQIALGLFFVIYVVLQNVFFWREFTSVNSRSPLFFAFLYLVGGYLRKYPIERKVPWFRSYVACSMLTAISRFILSYVTIKIFGTMYGETIFYSYNSITMVVGSICLFMTFQNMKMNKDSFLGKVALWISPLTLGVYLIHEQPEMRTWLWSVLKPYQFANSSFIILIAVLMGQAILVFGVCCLLEKIRIIVTEKGISIGRKVLGR